MRRCAPHRLKPYKNGRPPRSAAGAHTRFIEPLLFPIGQSQQILLAGTNLKNLLDSVDKDLAIANVTGVQHALNHVQHQIAKPCTARIRPLVGDNLTDRFRPVCTSNRVVTVGTGA